MIFWDNHALLPKVYLESRQIVEARAGEEFRPPRFAFFCKKIWHKWFYQASVMMQPINIYHQEVI